MGAFVTWRWLSVACLGLSLLWSLTVLVNPESPAYLMSHKDFDGARASLQKLRGHDYIGNVQFYFVWWQYWPLDSALKIINFSKNLVFQKRNLVENQFLLIRNFAKNQFFKSRILLKIRFLNAELCLKISFSKEEFSRQSVFQKWNFGENVKIPSSVDCKRHWN